MKIIVFDLGGTLMQYEGMPYSWVEFYQQGFDSIIQKYNCNVSKEDIQKSVQILKDFNPRVSGREVEYSAEHIFSNALEHWHIDPPIKNCIETFWHGLKLSAKIYPDTIEVLKELKEKGYIIATLTDLPNAMPDEIFKKDISELLSYFDYMVSLLRNWFLWEMKKKIEKQHVMQIVNLFIYNVQRSLREALAVYMNYCSC